jgi:hypothetical protein
VQWTALAADAADYLHVAYYDGAFSGAGQQVGTVNYATNLTGSWRVEAIGSVAPTVYGSIALRVTPDGSIHVVWYDFQTGFRLLHAVKQAGIWSTEVIAANALNVTTVAMASDAAGVLHVVYNPEGKVTYATNLSGSWRSEPVGDSGIVYGGVRTCAIAASASGQVHIGYYDHSTRNLKYARKNAGVWVTETVDAQADVGLHTAIALDAIGDPHLAYYDVVNGDLRHATRSGGGWVAESLDSSDDVGTAVDMIRDAVGHLHVSYADETRHALKYATNSSGSWRTYTIDGSSVVAGFTAIATDSAGRVSISYRGDARVRIASDH